MYTCFVFSCKGGRREELQKTFYFYFSGGTEVFEHGATMKRNPTKNRACGVLGLKDGKLQSVVIGIIITY